MFSRTVFALARTRVPLAIPARTFRATPAILLEYPRRPQASFMIFSNEHREAIKQEKPDLSVTEAARLLAERFRNLPEQDRKKYDEAAERARQEYTAAMEKYRAQVKPRPKPLHLNSQLKAIAEKKGIAPTLANLAEINQSLTEADKEQLRKERTADLERTKVAQEKWDRAHASGLAMVKTLDEKLLFSKRVDAWFEIARGRRWKSLVEFPRHFADLSKDQVEEVKAIRRKHRNNARRIARRELRAHGFFDEAESI